MTYENALRMTSEMNDEGITGICQAACLDGILNRLDVPREYYAGFAKARQAQDSVTFRSLQNQLASLIHPSGDYFEGYGNIVGHRVGEAHSIDPLSHDGKDETTDPRPELMRLQSCFDHTEAELADNDFGEERNRLARSMVSRKVALAVVLDNALDNKLTVMGYSGENHTFGVRRDVENTCYVVNTKKPAPGETDLTKDGPLTLEEVVGLYPTNRPVHWPASENHFMSPFRQIKTKDGYVYDLQLFPPEGEGQ